MCTVLQQHLALAGRAETPGDGSTTPASSYYARKRDRTLSPAGREQTQTYSYIADVSTLKRPIDPYDRKVSTPTPHFHVPPANPDGTRPSSRQKNAYTQSLYGRRSRSHSRTGMRVLMDQLEDSKPRPRSPHMNNEEPINLSHYPDGRAPEDNKDKTAPIEREDFPAPPFAYTDGRKKKKKRRRCWSEPGKRMHFCKDTDTEEESVHGEDSPYESSSSDIDPKEVQIVDRDMEKKETELKKITSGMAKVFLTELAAEKEKIQSQKHRMIDPRSAARTPAANREPHFRLRYDSPVNASPSRVADHLRPWDDEITIDGRSISRRSLITTPFTPLGRTVSPVNVTKTGYAQSATKASTLPSRFSPGYSDDKHGGYSTDFTSSKSDFSDGEGVVNGVRTRTSTPKGRAVSSAGASEHRNEEFNRSFPDIHPSGSVPGSLGDSGCSGEMGPLQAANVYPLHLLLVTNYRLPGDVDRANLEKHLTDRDFDNVFRMSRVEFYQLSYWKRCDIKRKANLF